MKLQDFAQVVRSKNVGPRRFTLDIIFRDDADYQRAVRPARSALPRERFRSLAHGPLDRQSGPHGSYRGHCGPKIAHAIALNRSKRIARRSRSGRSLIRLGR
jgi:hypothetical protein